MSHRPTMKFKRGDLIDVRMQCLDYGIVCETETGYTKVYFLADLTTEWMCTSALILVRGSNPSIEAETAPVGASSDSERHKTPVEAPSPPAKREAL